jgi:hypothetical protein
MMVGETGLVVSAEKGIRNGAGCEWPLLVPLWAAFLVAVSELPLRAWRSLPMVVPERLLPPLCA